MQTLVSGRQRRRKKAKPFGLLTQYSLFSARRKIRCDKQIPCGNCVRLGVSQTCLANSLSFQASSFLATTSSTSQLQIGPSLKKEKLSRRKACDRCVGRKIYCDKKFPCEKCERSQVPCHYSGGKIRECQEVNQKPQIDSISLDDKNLDHFKSQLPPLNVIEEIFQVIHQGDVSLHFYDFL